MVCLNSDDEFILLFPAVSSTLHLKSLPTAANINQRIDYVLIQSCMLALEDAMLLGRTGSEEDGI